MATCGNSWHNTTVECLTVVNMAHSTMKWKFNHQAGTGINAPWLLLTFQLDDYNSNMPQR